MKALKPSSSSKVPTVDERTDPKLVIRQRETSGSVTSLDALDVDELLEKICNGEQEIVTFKGSSQYGDKMGNRISASTCGLAALNFARVAFKLEKEENMQGLELLSELLSHKTNQVCALSPREFSLFHLLMPTTQEITSVCDYWKSDSHLEIEELLKVPIFRNSLALQTCTYSDASKQRFYDLLQ
jgi:hypothetical protein